MPVTIAVEGEADVGVARKLLATVGLRFSGTLHVTRGKGRLDQQLRGYRNAARTAPWFILRDLDADAPCAGELVSRLVRPMRPVPMFCFRVAIRASEAWLLADRERMAAFLGVAAAVIPASPEALEHPKLTLVNLARRSRRRHVRADMVPVRGTTARVGPQYVYRLGEFATEHWRPRVAARSSPSLRRCLAALERLKSHAA